MNERMIYKISIVAVVLGLGFLYLYAEEAETGLLSYTESLQPEEKVILNGVVTRVNMNDKVTFLEVQGERVETVDVVLFGEKNVFVREGDHVEIEGTVEEYQGKKEVIANKVVLR